MQQFIDSFISYIKYLSTVLPLEVFVFIGTIIEELVGPIPSPLIMTTAGTIAKSLNQPFLYLLYLSLIATAGKMIVSIGLYYLGDKAEDLIVEKYGKYLGITSASVQSIQKYFNNDWKDVFALFMLRVIPFVSTGVVSLASGILKVQMKTFVVASTLGMIVRHLIFLSFGYVGLQSLSELYELINIVQLVIAIGACVLIGVAIYLVKNYRMKEKLKNQNN